MPGNESAAFPVFPWWMRLRARTPVRIAGEAVARFLPACHAWLATENTRFLARWLAPDPRGCPPWIGNTSDRALVWSLIVFTAHSFGPAAIQKRSGFLQNALLDEHAAPGDLLALHRDLERLAVLWLAETGQRVPHLSSSTRGGGLRTETFPQALAALPASYKNALLLLASFSPLTRLAYLDHFTDKPRPHVFASLGGVLCTDGQNFAPWLALLADTLLGAVLSTPPDLGAWKKALAELRSLEAESAHWGFFQRLFGIGRVKRARAREEWLRVRVRDTLLARFEAWSGIARAGSAEELHLMTLERLARMAAVRATPSMRDEWHRASRANPMSYAAVELFRPGSAYYVELTGLVLAGPLNELRQLLSTPEQSRLGELLDGVLNVPAPSDVPGHLQKFFDDLAGIRLPFRPRNHRGPCPATIFSELLVQFAEVFPQPTEPAAQEEPDNAYAAG
jgi:hypothetical protein